jgi:hypothetical protein
MPSHQIRVQQNNCMHSWYLSYNQEEDWYYEICTYCSKRVKICKSDNGNTPKNLSKLCDQVMANAKLR